ncbi:MAG: acetyl-CoA carboxylase biotin carboxyl carrier protein [Opitutales bacterium]
MDLKEIKQIVDLMKRSALTEFEIEEEGLKLRICRHNGESQPIIQASPATSVAPVAAPPVAAVPGPAPVEDASKLIKSPMVGTFYSAPSPDSESFVKVGDKVTADSVVCIVEAMKVMNEIKAEVAGTITEVCLTNGDTVEFGQPLFKVK